MAVIGANRARAYRDRAVELLALAMKTGDDAERVKLIAEALDEHAEHVREVLKNEREFEEETKS